MTYLLQWEIQAVFLFYGEECRGNFDEGRQELLREEK